MLFQYRYHKDFGERAPQKMVKRIAEQANLNFKVHPYSFRHSRATLLAERGMSLQKFKSFLGHESEKTTKIYTRTAQHNLRYKINELEPYDVLPQPFR